MEHSPKRYRDYDFGLNSGESSVEEFFDERISSSEERISPPKRFRKKK